MVREITILPNFAPRFIKKKYEIPVFQYQKSLKEELEEKNLTEKDCLDILKCMLYIRNFEEMIQELREKKEDTVLFVTSTLGQLIFL